MDPTSPESQPRSDPHQGPEQQPDHHHPVPSGLVRLYGLLAVLFVLLPEWMADLRQRSRNVRVQDHGEDRDRLSIPLSRSAQQSFPRAPWLLPGARAALWVGVGAGLVWGANQLRPLSQWPLPKAGPAQAVPSEHASPTPGASVPVGQLRLHASGPSWVEVRSLGGRSLYAAILHGQVQLPLGQGVTVLAGRPDLVRVSVAGQQPKVLGRIDQIAWVEVPVPSGVGPP
jgi:hypothetical protein